MSSSPPISSSILGPEGGAAGGRIVAAGTPEEVAAVGESATGRFLSDLLSGRNRQSMPAAG